LKLQSDPSRWDELLAENGCGDAYYVRGFIESAATALGGEAFYLRHTVRGGTVAFPCIVRETPGGAARDVTTFAYGGPIALGDDPSVEDFNELYESWCAEEEIVATFIRYHPLYGNQRLAKGELRLQQVEGSVTWPLKGDLFAGMHPHHRRLVRKAQRTELEVVRTGAERLDSFAELYEQTMRRVGAASLYFFPDEYWARLADGLGDRLVCLEVRLEGRVLAAVLCLATPPWLHYHLGGSSDEGRKLGASHLLLYSAAVFGQESGFDQFHLGSGLGGGGGALLEFKRRFSPASLLEQWFGKAVHDLGWYLELTGEERVDYEGFFPAYRRF
jgi:hypothetical protein